MYILVLTQRDVVSAGPAPGQHRVLNQDGCRDHQRPNDGPCQLKGYIKKFTLLNWVKITHIYLI